MTMTESALSPAPTLRGWFRAACRQLAPNPPTRQPSGLSSPAWGSCAEPGSRRRSATADIAAEDWDLLFRAALELLARVAVEKAAPDSTDARLQAPGTALRECIDALDRLRRSVPHP